MSDETRTVTVEQLAEALRVGLPSKRIEDYRPEDFYRDYAAAIFAALPILAQGPPRPRQPFTEAGRALARQSMSKPVTIDQILDIEDEAAALPTSTEGLDVERLRSFAEKVARSENDTAGTRAAARYALTGSLDAVVYEMRRSPSPSPTETPEPTEEEPE